MDVELRRRAEQARQLVLRAEVTLVAVTYPYLAFRPLSVPRPPLSLG